MNYSDPNRGFNPYAPPNPDADLLLGGGRFDAGEHILASRGTRFVAVLLDGLLVLPLLIGAALLGFTFGMARRTGGSAWSDDSIVIVPIVLIAVIYLFGLIGYQWYLIATRGQTLGKKWLGIKIVKVDGSPVDFVSGVILRSWVISLLGAIPYLGSCVTLVDALMIFGEERRCLHDHIAGTKVIVVPPGYS